MTPTDQPIACTLTAAELPQRLAEIRAIGGTSLRSVNAGSHRAVLRFGTDPDTRERLQAIVAAEASCCAFLGFDLKEASEGLVLTIRAPEGGEPVMHQLVAAFRGQSVVTG